MVSGKGARNKGSQAERKVRDQLKRIYDPKWRGAIHRVPMSGASFMKGDVVDMNDTQMSYEVKNQEKLAIPEWWEQSKAQAQPWQIPVLVFTSNYRPFYWMMHRKDWEAFLEDSGHIKASGYIDGNTRSLYDKLDSLDRLQYYVTKVHGDEVAIVRNEDYIEVKKEIHDAAKHAGKV